VLGFCADTLRKPVFASSTSLAETKLCCAMLVGANREGSAAGETPVLWGGMLVAVGGRGSSLLERSGTNRQSEEQKRGFPALESPLQYSLS